MKATLEFNLPEESEEHDHALNGWKYVVVLEDIHEKVWRPSWKHGYPQEELNKLLEDENCRRTLELLHEIYCETINERKL